MAEGVAVGGTDGVVAAAGRSAFVSLAASSERNSCDGLLGDAVLGSVEVVESVCVLWVGLG